MSTMRIPHSVCTISWLLLIALVGAAELTNAVAKVAEEKIGDFLKYANGTALDTPHQPHVDDPGFPQSRRPGAQKLG